MTTKLEVIAEQLVKDDVWAHWSADGIPHCDIVEFPNYDGKRCRKTGFRPPGGLCEPAIVAMREALEALPA